MKEPPILEIPLEIFEQIIDLVSGTDLANLGLTCKRINQLINSERNWKYHCNSELGIYNCSPYENFEQCFKRLYRHRWFKPAIWFGDKDPFGSLAVSSFNDKNGCFEFYEIRSSMAQVEVLGGHNPEEDQGGDQLSAVRRIMNGRDREEEGGEGTGGGTAGTGGPERNNNVSRETSNRQYDQEQEVPTPTPPSTPLSRSTTPRIKSSMAHHISYSEPLITINSETDYNDERTLVNFSQSRGLFRCLMRASALLPERIHPSMSIWPPTKIPAQDRTRNVSSTEFRGHLSKSSSPSNDLLRIRTWLNYSGSIGFTMMGETVETFSKLSTDLLTPTPDTPWKGLWIYRSEYMGEFLLFHQSSPQNLEAIKLTGNNKIPRGEIAFYLADVTRPVPESLKFVPEFIIRKRKPVFDAKYQTSLLNYTNPQFLNGQVVFYDSDAILLYDEYGSYVGDCCRVNDKLLVEGKLSHVAYP